MKLVTKREVIETTTIDYTPSLDELFYYYRGTSGSWNPDNPYNTRRNWVRKVVSINPKQETSNG